MARTEGALNQATIEFDNKVQALIDQGYPDPVTVLMQLCKSRKQNIRLQAASKLMEYRYAKRVAVRLEDDNKPTQMALAWEDSTDQPPAEPIDITDQVEVIEDGNT